MYASCINSVLIIEVCVPSLYTWCIYNMYTKYVSCIQNVQKYVQNTYRLDVMVAGFLLAKPPPSTTQNGMFLSYNHYKTRICHVRFTNIVYKMYTIKKILVYKTCTKCWHFVNDFTYFVCILYTLCIQGFYLLHSYHNAAFLACSSIDQFTIMHTLRLRRPYFLGTSRFIISIWWRTNPLIMNHWHPSQ